MIKMMILDLRTCCVADCFTVYRVLLLEYFYVQLRVHVKTTCVMSMQCLLGLALYFDDTVCVYFWMIFTNNVLREFITMPDCVLLVTGQSPPFTDIIAPKTRFRRHS